MHRDDTLALMIDIQEKFRPAIAEIDRVIDSATTLLKAWSILDVPVVVTEQYPRGLGSTVEELADLIPTPMEKVHFSCFGDNNIAKKIGEYDRENLVLIGIEAHVCVLNTALNALEEGYTPHVVVDAVASRHDVDYETALTRMTQEGVHLATVEILLFQLLEKAGTPEFKAISKLIK